MKIRKTFKLIFMALAVMTLSSGCNDDDNSNVTDNDNNSGQLSFTVDGEVKSLDATALHIITDENTPNSTAINDNELGETTLQIILQASPGDLVTYDVSNLEDSDNHVIVSILYSEGNGTFFNTNTSDGQISISEYTDSSLSGSFNATLENPVSGEELSISNGSFTNLVVSENVD